MDLFSIAASFWGTLSFWTLVVIGIPLIMVLMLTGVVLRNRQVRRDQAMQASRRNARQL